MHSEANARYQWIAVTVIVAAFAGVGVRVAQGQDSPEGGRGALAASGPRFLAAASSRSGDRGGVESPRWTDASNAAVFRKQISLDLHDVSLADALSTIAEQEIVDVRETKAQTE